MESVEGKLAQQKFLCEGFPTVPERVFMTISLKTRTVYIAYISLQPQYYMKEDCAKSVKPSKINYGSLEKLCQESIWVQSCEHPITACNTGAHPVLRQQTGVYTGFLKILLQSLFHYDSVKI